MTQLVSHGIFTAHGWLESAISDINQGANMRLAHISDLHILDLKDATLKTFMNRRAIGSVNVFFNRKRQYQVDILERLIEDILREDVDHVAITGDLTNLALDSEFERVFHLVKLLGGYDLVSVVPGNHDKYTVGSIEKRRFERYFHQFMYHSYSDIQTNFYPWDKTIGNVHLIGLSSPTKTIPPLSNGIIGDKQLDALERLLTNPHHAHLRKVVMLHHALHTRSKTLEMTSGLKNRDKLIRMMLENKVDLALYGHDHHGQIWKLEEGTHTMHLINCGSSTRLPQHSQSHLRAKYRIITLDEDGVRKIETKVYNPDERRFYRSLS
jgi:3',5'-cyclic AMP phosphodiesterase CpdA